MSCHHTPGGLQDLLDDIWGKRPTLLKQLPQLPTARPAAPAPLGASRAPAGPGATPSTLSPFQFAKKIERVLDEYVRPMLQHDGGDLELVDIKDNLVYCRLGGACVSCAASTRTLHFMVERALKDQVDERIRVIAVGQE